MSQIRWSALPALALCMAVGSAAVPAQDAASKKPAAEAQEKTPAKATLDKPVKDFKLRDLMHEAKDGEKEDDAFLSLGQFKDKKPVLLFFMSEHCSVTWRYEKRMGQMLAKYGDKNVTFLGVRCSANDTPEGLKKFAEAKNFAMPLLDDEKGEMATYFKIRCTPTFALIDTKGVLRYLGSFDDTPDEKDVSKKFVPDAIVAVLNGKSVMVKQNAPFG